MADANLSGLAQQISKFSSDAASHLSTFRQTANEQNRSVSKMIKDVAGHFTRQNGSLENISSAMSDNAESTNNLSRKIDNNTGVLNQSVGMQSSMLGELQNINSTLGILIRVTKQIGMRGSSGGGTTDPNNPTPPSLTDKFYGFMSNMFPVGGKFRAAGRIAGAAAGVLGAGAAGVGGYNVFTGGNEATQDIAKNKQYVLKAMNDHGITDNDTRAAMAAQISGESGWKPQSEQSYENTSVENIRKSFGANSPIGRKSDQELETLKKDPKKFFNAAYGGRLGNTEEDDGYKFRGRGYFQLTGKSNYARYSKLALGDEKILLQNPDLANDPEISAKLFAEYQKDRLKNSSGPNAYERVANAQGNKNPVTEQKKVAAYQQFKSTGEFSSDKKPNEAILAGSSTGASAPTPPATPVTKPTATSVTPEPEGGSQQAAMPSSKPDVTGGQGENKMDEKQAKELIQSRQVGGGNFAGVNADKLNSDFAIKLAQAIKMTEAETGEGSVKITEGYRSPETQAQYYANYTKRQGYPNPIDYNGKLYYPDPSTGSGGIAAPPGRSNHQKGMAVDVAGGPAREVLRTKAARVGITNLGATDPPHFEISGAGSESARDDSGSRERPMTGQQVGGGMMMRGGMGIPMMGMNPMMGRGGLGALGMGMMNPGMGMMMGGMGRTGGLIGLGANLLGSIFNRPSAAERPTASARLVAPNVPQPSREIERAAVQDKVEDKSKGNQPPVIVQQGGGGQQGPQNPVNDPSKRNKVTSAANPWAEELKEYYKHSLA